MLMTRWKSSRAAKDGVAEATQLGHALERQIETEVRKRLAMMSATIENLEPRWQRTLENGAGYVIQAARIRHAIRTACHDGLVAEAPSLRFQVSSLFLQDAVAYLQGDPDGKERLTLISGTVGDDGVRVLSRMLQVPMDKASPAYVRADPKLTHKTIVQLVERDGHQMFCMWHSHIMRGADSTQPSGIDLANQERFCAMGWDEVLAGICSIDGYFRIFSTARDFALTVYGNRVDIVSDHPREKLLKLSMDG